MKQQFVHSFTGDKKKTGPILSRRTLQHITFLRKYKVKHFFFYEAQNGSWLPTFRVNLSVTSSRVRQPMTGLLDP